MDCCTRRFRAAQSARSCGGDPGVPAIRLRLDPAIGWQRTLTAHPRDRRLHTRPAPVARAIRRRPPTAHRPHPVARLVPQNPAPALLLPEGRGGTGELGASRAGRKRYGPGAWACAGRGTGQTLPPLNCWLESPSPLGIAPALEAFTHQPTRTHARSLSAFPPPVFSPPFAAFWPSRHLPLLVVPSRSPARVIAPLRLSLPYILSWPDRRLISIQRARVVAPLCFAEQPAPQAPNSRCRLCAFRFRVSFRRFLYSLASASRQHPSLRTLLRHTPPTATSSSLLLDFLLCDPS